MLQLALDQTAKLRNWFLPDRPGPLVGLHVIQTGHGHCWVDRWPSPRAVLVETAGNYALAGDPNALTSNALKGRISGFVDAPETHVPLLKATFPDLVVWDRVIFALQSQPRFSVPQGHVVRRLSEADVRHLQALSPDASWIAKTWGGPTGLASSGCAWGAFAEGDRLVSVACTFFMGERYEDIGVATEPAFRGRGLSVACAGALCEDIQTRGRIPSWTTSPDNIASVRVAEKLGFSFQRHDYLYVTGIKVPETPRR